MTAPRPGASAGFDYWNVRDPAPRPFLTAAGLVFRGIARVQAQVEPYAGRWREHNAAVVAAVVAAAAGDVPLWIALGDSMTLGVGASAYDRGWVGQLAARRDADERHLDVVNLGVSGARTVEVIERQLPVLDMLSEPTAPALVTLMIGSNDLLRRRNRDGLVERFEQILRRLPARAVVTTLPNPSRVAAAVNARIEQVGAERGLVVADLRSSGPPSWRGKLAADHFHPNDLGYAALADALAPAVERALTTG
jgi:lysophospholipase L1-like esterase